ncbi:hypothetical protein FNJ88_00320 [Chryseobacterium sp. SNU WT5]|uniref:hypothetical protein n=1 Tax=Chryseobacterium sp. SNU WT5 TaxID=2594269 RepID=UPI00118128D3|nr:hypothetical protein [Chryseobacterium sp. SNU WT5]QDP84070.1 hypothetical protein FNJ88_00320 [Chryseobacterium sp. SNU WT5]
MKRLFAVVVLGTLCFTSCAQKEEKREEFKDEHSVEQKRNAGVDSAAFNDENQRQDSLSVK